MSDRVAAIVVTHNRKSLLMECLDALLGQSRSLSRLFVVDNASTDGTAEMLREKGYRNNQVVEYILLDKNMGGSGGFNAGLKAASERGFDWFWLMDDDAEPAQDALEKLLGAGLHLLEDTVGLACLNVALDGQVQMIHRGRFFERPLRWVPLSPADYERDSCPIGYSSFVGILVRATTVRQVGFPRADFFLQHDDIEYSYRLYKEGKLYLVKGSVIRHKDARMQPVLAPSTRGGVPVEHFWIMYYAIRNRILLSKIHEKSRWFRMRASWLTFLYLLRKSAGIILFDDCKGWRIRLIWAGYMHGLAGLSGWRVDHSQRKIVLASCEIQSSCSVGPSRSGLLSSIKTVLNRVGL